MLNKNLDKLNQYPTEPGHYWMKKTFSSDWRMVQVYMYDSLSMSRGKYLAYRQNTTVIDVSKCGHMLWDGPLQPPDY